MIIPKQMGSRSSIFRLFPLDIRVLCLVGLFVPFGNSGRSLGAEPTLLSTIERASEAHQFVLPSAGELRTVEQLFERTFELATEARSAPSGNAANAVESQFAALTDQWAAHQMKLRRWTRYRFDDGEVAPIWVLRETSRRQEGRGFYVFLPASRGQEIVEAPHSFHDKYTRTIAERLFRSGQFRAASWNTVKRSVVDVAHARFHYLNAFTRAAQATDPATTVVQIHGYAAMKRKTPAGMSADMILSNGTDRPHTSLVELQQRLQTVWPKFAVLAYPTDVRELGATKNVQAELLRAAGSDRFLHVEMSRRLRLSLASDAIVRSEFLEALAVVCRR
jgi:hypothetical protein